VVAARGRLTFEELSQLADLFSEAGSTDSIDWRRAAAATRPAALVGQLSSKRWLGISR